jgi:hypothetical protein
MKDYKCDDRPHKWTKWRFAAYKEEGGAIEERHCKWCGKTQHKNIQCVN